MATVMEFTVPANEFPLGSIFDTLPEATVELERLIPHDGLIIPYFWVRGGEVEDIEAAFAGHEGVTDIDLIDTVEDEYLMRANWKSEYFGILSALSAAHIVVLNGMGRKVGWTFEVRGEDREAISEFRTECQQHDIPIEIDSVHSLLPIQEEDHELTGKQREAIVLAFEMGYYDSPRATSLEEIAEELEITQQSLSSRIRRGLHRLVYASLLMQ